jgi:hypothetical protein
MIKASDAANNSPIPMTPIAIRDFRFDTQWLLFMAYLSTKSAVLWCDAMV